MLGIRDTVIKLDKKTAYQGDIIEGHTRILKQQLFDKRRESDIKTSLSYEIGGLPTEASHEEKARYTMSLMTKAGIPSHEVANMGYKVLSRGTEVWGLEFRSNGIKPKLDKATRIWGDCFFEDGKGNTNSTWWRHKTEFIWPETMAQKDIRTIRNRVWQSVKEIVGEDIIKSEKGLYIHHRSASIVPKPFGVPVVKIALDENPEDPTCFVYIADKCCDGWRHRIDRRIREEEKTIAQRTFKGKGKGKDKNKGKEKVININPHEFIKASRRACWHKSMRLLSTFSSKRPDEWKEIDNQKDLMKSTGEQKGKQKGEGKGWNNWNNWKDWSKESTSEGSTKASEWGDLSTTEWPKQQQQQWPKWQEKYQ